ncbi:MAG: NADH-quinone oxidoreductase subunit A [Thermodesulfobacteriota bacterium]
MTNPYIALLISFVLCALVAAIMMSASWILGPKRASKAKLEIFETGNPPLGSIRGIRFPVKFYLVAILFVVFDVEVVFMYPWAVVFRRLGWMGLAEMGAFVAVLGVGLAYVWRVGALEWE